jgi:hypothetical protein
MSPIRNVDPLKIALLFAALFVALLTLHTGACMALVVLVRGDYQAFLPVARSS